MKNKSCLLIGMASLLLTNCGETTKPENLKYEDIKTQIVDKEFAFESALKEKGLAYPLSNGRCFYFSNDGNDTNDGLSPDTPKKTLSEANSLKLTAGDSLLFKKGDTFVGNLFFSGLRGDDDNPITIASYGEGDIKPIITNGSPSIGVDPVVVAKSSNVVIRDLEVNVFAKKRNESGTQCLTGIEILYQREKDNKYRNIYVVNNTVKGNGVDANIMGIVLQSEEDTSKTSPDDVLTNGVFSYNEVFNIGRSGIHSGGWLFKQSVNQNEGNIRKYKNLEFNHNIVHDVGCIGIYPMDVTNATCNYNLVYNTGMYNVNEVMEGECGIMTLCAENVDVMFNEIYNCFDQRTGFDAMGIDIDWNCNKINVQYNYCHDNQGPGIGTMANQNSFIRNNKLVRNQGATNHKASISVTNFTSKYDGVNPDWHSVKNLKIEENLIIHDNPYSHAFKSSNSNGDLNYEKNDFYKNRVIFTGDPDEFTWVNISKETPFYYLGENHYYSQDTSKFIAFDDTDYFDMNSPEYGGECLPYDPTNGFTFDAWKVRDVNSTYELIDEDIIAANPFNPDAKFEDGKLKLSWINNDGDLWHYNIHKVKENEDLSYFNLLGETKENYFEYEPEYKEDAFFIIQPESNQGTFGKAIKLKISY